MPKGLPFDTISAALADVARRLVLGQLQNLDHGTLNLHDTGCLKHKFGVPIVKYLTGREVHGTMRPLEDGQLHKERALVVELHIHFLMAWRRILFGNDVGFAEAYMLGEISCSP